jgi:hypothetical protein
MRKFWIALGLLAATAAIAGGLKPFQVKAKTESDKDVQLDLKKMNEACGTKIDADLDVSAYAGDDWTKYVPEKPGQICGHAIYGIGLLCKDAAYKPAVADGLKKIVCTCDGTADPIAKNVTFSGGTLTFKMNIKHDNMSPDREVRFFLAKELNK